MITEKIVNEKNNQFDNLAVDSSEIIDNTCVDLEQSSEETEQIVQEISNFDNEISQTSENTEKKETVETNCLSLTVCKNYNISVFKNTVFTTFRVTCKITIFTLVLNLLRLFFLILLFYYYTQAMLFFAFVYLSLSVAY